MAVCSTGAFVLVDLLAIGSQRHVARLHKQFTDCYCAILKNRNAVIVVDKLLEVSTWQIRSGFLLIFRNS